MQDTDKKNEPFKTEGKESETPPSSSEVPPPQLWGADSQPEPVPEATPEPDMDQQAAEKPADAQPTPTRRSGSFGAILWTLLVVAALGIGAYFTQPLWRPHVEAYLPATASDDAQVTEGVEALAAEHGVFDERLSAIEDRLALLEEEVVALRESAASIPQQALSAAPGSADPDTSGESSAGEDSGSPGSVSELVERTDALETKDSEIADRLQKLEQRTNALSQVNNAQQDVIARMEQEPSGTQVLLPRIEQLEADSLQSKRLADRLRELEASETEAQDSAVQLVATVLAVNQLREMLDSSAPYAAQLSSLEALAGNNQEIETEIAALAQHADEGIPSVAALRARFPKVASAVGSTGAQVEGDGWAERTLNSLTSLVSVRRTGKEAVAAGGTEGALAQAELSLAEGDLPAAVSALESLEDPSATAAAQVWLDDARARVEANEAIARLSDFVIAQLAGGRS